MNTEKAKEKTGTIILKVAEAGSKDVGRGIVRLDPADFQKIGIEVGDVVSLTGKRKTVAKVLPAYMEDRGQRVIRLDGIAGYYFPEWNLERASAEGGLYK